MFSKKGNALLEKEYSGGRISIIFFTFSSSFSCNNKRFHFFQLLINKGTKKYTIQLLNYNLSAIGTVLSLFFEKEYVGFKFYPNKNIYLIHLAV